MTAAVAALWPMAIYAGSMRIAEKATCVALTITGLRKLVATFAAGIMEL
jgi:hypothetical protein